YGDGTHGKYQTVRPRMINRLWTGLDGSSWGTGSGYWDQYFWIADGDLETWVDISLDLTPRSVGLHNRVFWIGFAIENGNNPPEALLLGANIVYYISDIRFTK
ncbi:hypothetical protein, partial [Candidatus Symbiothrix dinenymphae]|uniref:hypothetical protein n=1 Tax=Candidatus Symbiothrix dinenymphae TaxID=467085 RepID=UPI000702624D